MKSDKKKYLIRLSSKLSVFIASIVLALKFVAWLYTDSASVLASVVDSFLDITSSIINLIAIRYSLMPPDDNHRFGHDKIQDLVVFGQGIFFITSGLFVIFNALIKINSHPEVYNSDIGIYAILLSTIATIVLTSFQTYVIKQTDSKVIKADRLHYLTDIMSNMVVIFSIYLSKYISYLDSVFAMFIAFYLINGAVKLLIDSLRNLLDQEFDPEEKNKILTILKSYKEKNKIHSAHDIKTRKAGSKYFIQFHVEITGELTLNQTHEIVESIEKDILKLFPECEIIIHQDPYGHEEEVSFRDELSV